MKRRNLTTEETIGTGRQCLYVYFSASERRLAQLEGRTSWPCKVGRSNQEVSKRIMQQRPVTAMAALPIVGLLVRTADAVALESLVHCVLRGLQARVEGALGRDWFHTSPDQVRAIVEGKLSAPAKAPKPARSPRQDWNPPTSGLLGELFRDMLRFLDETGMSETRFGVAATGNCALFHAISRGKDIRATTYDKIRDFIASSRAVDPKSAIAIPA